MSAFLDQQHTIYHSIHNLGKINLLIKGILTLPIQSSPAGANALIVTAQYVCTEWVNALM